MTKYLGLYALMLAFLEGGGFDVSRASFWDLIIAISAGQFTRRGNHAPTPAAGVNAHYAGAHLITRLHALHEIFPQVDEVFAPGGAIEALVEAREQGIVQGIGVVVDWAALGYTVEVSLRITLDKTQSNAFDVFLAAARKVPEVIEIQTFLGLVDVRLSVIARDMGHYQQIYRSQILSLPHIADIEALMQVARIKDAEGLPL